MNEGTIRRMLLLIPTAAALLAGTAKADVITFKDNYGIVTGTTTFGGDFSCGPTAGVCQVLQTGLFGYQATSSFVDTPIASPIYIGDGVGNVSAKLVTVIGGGLTSPAGSGYAIAISYYFTGGLDLSSPFTCESVGGCQIVQDGTLQFLGETTYNETTGYIGPVQFPPSVVDFEYTTPEPAGVQLFAAGLVGLAGWKRIRSGRRRGTAV